MPRFHFNVVDGRDPTDTEGMDFPDVAAARVEAVRLAGGMLKGDPVRMGRSVDWHVLVTDVAGLMLVRIDVLILQAPTARN